ncbi:MAG: nucleotide sugar dehydrogenase [Pseudomonadota bacterium]
MNHKTLLTNKIRDKNAVIGIYGLGYVGLPLALRFAEAGFKVIGFDIDSGKVEQLNSGSSYIERIGPDQIKPALQRGFRATTNFSETKSADCLIICVPTPLGKHRDPDLSFVIGTIDAIVPFARKGQVICLESTTYPGTTDDELTPRLEKVSLEVGNNIFAVYSPEREDPGNLKFSTQTIPKVCGGVTEDCLEVGVALYEQVIDQVVSVSSARAAEMTKLLENIYRAVNIGLVNELKVVADKMDIDIYEVIDAASTKPFGFVPFYPGPGLGGHCIPIDPFYLTWKARSMGIDTAFIELAGTINSQMPKYVLEKVVLALNDAGVAINGSKILILGLSYKKDVDDSRESPAIYIYDQLVRLGADVSYSDPHIPSFPEKRDYNYPSELTSYTRYANSYS